MKLRPLMDRVVLRQVENEEVSKGGIILTNAAKEKPQMAEVVAPAAWWTARKSRWTLRPGIRSYTVSMPARK